MEFESNNKRILKNTLYLYIRMFITMLIGLYTSRVVLHTLGIVDFGIYNVVGGIVIMLNFLSNSMSNASERFLAFEIGKGDEDKLQNIFATIGNIYLTLSGFIFILSETVGLWFVTNKLNIPSDRLSAALFVYQLSIFSFIFTILRIPFNAEIVAHERMNFYALIGIVETVAKLVIVFLLVILDLDKLKLYSVLMCAVVLLTTTVFSIYCKINFSECRFKLFWDKKIFNSIFSFAGWSLFENLSFVSLDQGVNILINLFFGPTVNAARGVAYQVKAQIVSFVGNFQIAASPQIVKYYAMNEIDKMKKLTYDSSRISYYLLLILSLPAIIEMDFLLRLWLYKVPPYTIIFTRLILVNSLADCMGGTINTAALATGKIKYYQLFSGIVLLLVIPLSYISLHLGYPPEITIIIAIVFSIIALFVKLYILKTILNFSMLEYLHQVVFYNIMITLIASVIPVFVYLQMSNSFVSFLIVIVTAVISSITTIYFLGLKNEEKIKVRCFISKKYFSKF